MKEVSHIHEIRDSRVVVPPEVLQAKIDRTPQRILIFRQQRALVYDLLTHKKRKVTKIISFQPRTPDGGDDVA